MAVPMTEHLPRRTKLVWLAISELAAQSSRAGITLTDLGSYLRDRDTPLGAWEIRGELSDLEDLGLVRFDGENGCWDVIAAPRDTAAGEN